MSVIVPVRNRRELLRRCLDALADQTVADHEVIVVDDGSGDGSAEEAEADARAGRPVRVLRTPSVGAVAARSAGVRAARSRVLAFTDSDCVPGPGWLAAGTAAIRAGAAVAVGPTWPAGAVRPLERSLASDGRDGLYATSNAFYDRASFEAASGFDPRAGERLRFRPGRTLGGTGFGEDTLLAWRVIRAGGGVAVCPDAVVRHHVFPADAADSVRRAWSVGAFPALVREVPELRRTLLVDGVFLGGRRRLGLYAALLAALLGRRRAAGAGLAAWVLGRARTTITAETSRRRALWSAPAEVGVEAVTAVALLAGSVRHRSLVL
ncbi:MAG TPA: glycosyltransferase family A protein [Acidimicrobiales bacterium]|nr:glycosyltransferase family A protein [Acidimicrobiales bacterium]